ncbi:uncharacterized protein BP5553_04971 [Venustampulla echinocandica]|uniref:Peptidase S8/S53 domain-containing protein n=1 Tax=Venustampulla echinocandica TaxID=2656787 RepID=A0A370TPU9_9HELO|nr:uncharacterized protein BP5553_04971 [Venustampulla echinocandica]RDL37538.1 hypothetical protein BP5553_04971 [Venustampulla echinocandica]
MDNALRQLVLEINRQFASSRLDGHLEATTNGGVISRWKQGHEYRLLLSTLKNCLSSSQELPGDVQMEQLSQPQDLALWPILAFCEPESSIDPEASKSQSKALQSVRSMRALTGQLSIQSGREVWKGPLALKWASEEQSSLILIEGSYQTVTDIESSALDVIEYFEEHNQRVIWILNDQSFYLNKWNSSTLLKQIAVQILSKNGTIKSLRDLALMVERFRAACSETDWFSIIAASLEGFSPVYMVIDLGPLRVWKTQTPSFGIFQQLFDALGKETNAIVKMALFSFYGFQGHVSTSKAPIVRLASQGVRSPSTPSTILGQDPRARNPRTKIGLPLLREIEALIPVPPLWQEPSVGQELGGVAASKHVKGPRDWFQEMESFEKCVDASRKEPDELSPRVKVALLDTGVDLSHPYIAREFQDGRIKCYDFVQDTNTIEDIDGHGTHCSSILAKLAPNAEIYVGRVLVKSQAERNSPATLTRAIQHASNIWKVDIISLSLGFTEDDEDLRDEIRKACASNILIFAAAANNTTNEITPIRFPARMKEVFCIFASNGHGRPSDFNPQPKSDRPNFTFPGEKVEGAWPAGIPTEGSFVRKDAVYKSQDGTSCATPVAAAVAAGILEFAWQERENQIRRVRLLKHYSGMSEIFLKLMVDDYRIGDNSYRYVKPWKLISCYARKDEIPIHMSHITDHIDG